MKKAIFKLGAAAIFLGALLIAPTFLTAEPTKIKNHVVKVNSKAYRRVAAESATLGAVGSKKNNGVGVGYFVRDSAWKAGKVKVQVHPPITISQRNLNALQGAVAVVFANGRANARARVGTDARRDFSLMKIDFVDHGEVMRAFNNKLSKNERKRIKRLKRGRMVTSVWVLVAGGNEDIARTFNSQGFFSMQNGEMNIQANAAANGSSTINVKFPVGSIVAYEFSKMRWKKGKKLKKLVVDPVKKVRI